MTQKYAKLTNGIPEFSTEYKHFVQDESGAYVLRVKTAEDFKAEGYKPYRLIELENPDVYDYTQIVYSETPEEVIATLVGVMYTDEEKEAIAQQEAEMEKQAFETAKQNKIDELKRARDTEEQTYFEYKGNKYDSDPISSQRIALASQNALTAKLANKDFQTYWTDYDNIPVLLNADGLIELSGALAEHSIATHTKYAQYKSQVEAITQEQGIEEINKIVWI